MDSVEASGELSFLVAVLPRFCRGVGDVDGDGEGCVEGERFLRPLNTRSTARTKRLAPDCHDYQ